MTTPISIPVPPVTVTPAAVTVTPPNVQVPTQTLLNQMSAADVSTYLQSLGYTVTPPTTPPVTPPVTTSPVPLGATGSWTCYLDEEFTGTSLNGSIWNPWWYQGGSVNNVKTSPSNVSVNNGLLTLTLSNATTGAAISSKPKNPSNTGFAIGGECFWEAKVLYPGNGSNLYNWNAFWVLRDNNTASDISIEIDIAETDGWSGPPNASGAHMNFNYIHGYPNTQQQQFFYGKPPNGYLGDTWHTYGLHRTATALTLYLGGVAQYTIPTVAGDQGKPQYCIFNIGVGGTRQVPSTMQVDYVRAWAPTGVTPNLVY